MYHRAENKRQRAFRCWVQSKMSRYAENKGDQGLSLEEEFSRIRIDTDAERQITEERKVYGNLRATSTIGDPRYEKERFTVVIDDLSVKIISEETVEVMRADLGPVIGDIRDTASAMKTFPELYVKAVQRQFEDAEIIPLTQFEEMLDISGVEKTRLDPRTLFVQFKWDGMPGSPYRGPSRLISERIADAMFKFRDKINVPLPNPSPSAGYREEERSNHVFRNPRGYIHVVNFTWIARNTEFVRKIFNGPDVRFRGEDFVVNRDRDLGAEKPGRIEGYVYPFIVPDPKTRAKLTEEDLEFNRRSVDMLAHFLRNPDYFHNMVHFGFRENETVNNAAQALQAIVAIGLVKARPRTSGVTIESPKWDEVRLDEGRNEEAHDAWVGFIGKDPVYHPKILMYVWDFLYMRKTQ